MNRIDGDTSSWDPRSKPDSLMGSQKNLFLNKKSNESEISDGPVVRETALDLTIKFGADREENDKLKGLKQNNSIRTSKYTWYTWAPLALLF